MRWTLILFNFFAVIHAIRSKRGLIVVNSANEQLDLPKYAASPLLSWVYNYSPQPSATVNVYPYGNLSFVPMLWGEDESNNFLTTVKRGPNHDYILAFNEPDMSKSVGGSELSVEQAVSIWQTQIQPLSESGSKLGSPAGSLRPSQFA